MTRHGWRLIFALLGALLLASPARAQQGEPHLAYVYPAGGQQGTTLTLTCGGQFLEGSTGALVTGRGVQAKVLDYARPLTPAQFDLLREQLKALRDKQTAAAAPAKGATTRPAFTAEDETQLAAIRKKLEHPPRRQTNPALAEQVSVEVTIAPDAPIGMHELRLVTARGISDPRLFCVGQLPEVARPLATDGRAPPDLDVKLPATINGQIMPGAVDRYRFTARKGQQIVAIAQARELIPYLSDAVPGWCQATVTLYDDQGAQVGYDDDFRFHPDPVLHVTIPRDGRYTLAINDAIYRGREDFVYRVAIGELPYITDVSPLGGRTGQAARVALRGWNLPTTETSVDPRTAADGVAMVRVTAGGVASNALPFAFDTLPECLAAADVATPATAQHVTLPMIVNGRISTAGQAQVFAFEGQAGHEVVAEVAARRLGSPLDSVLTLTDAAGQQLAYNDDTPDPAAGLETHHADSYLRVRLPADGTYFLRLADVQQQAGPAYAYRLRISAPRPDFVLRTVPSGINIRTAATVPITVHAIRRDGFAGDITLALVDRPAWLQLNGGTIPAGQDHITCTLTVSAAPPRAPVEVKLEGRATIAGRTVVHASEPAEDMQQAFSYRHLVPAQAQYIAVSGRWRTRLALAKSSAGTLQLAAGGAARLATAVPPTLRAGRVVLELDDPPPGITLTRTETGGAGLTMVLACDGKVPPGLRGNLVVTAFLQPAASAQAKAPRRVTIGTLPAVPFEVVAR